MTIHTRMTDGEVEQHIADVVAGKVPPPDETGPGPLEMRERKIVIDRREQLVQDVRYLLLGRSERTAARVEAEMRAVRSRYRGALPSGSRRTR